MAVFIQERRKPRGSSPGVMGLSRAPSKEGMHQYLKRVIQLLADDSQVSVFMLYILYLWSATLAAPLVFPRVFTLRAFFCCWYMPAKLNFLTHIKCTRQSWKLRKSPASPPLVCCSDKFLLSTAPHLHSAQCKEPLHATHPHHCPQRYTRFVMRRNRH